MTTRPDSLFPDFPDGLGNFMPSGLVVVEF